MKQIKAEDLLLLAVSSNVIEDILINNQNTVRYDVKKNLNIALKSINKVTSRFINDKFIEVIDQYKDIIIDCFNETMENHKKNDEIRHGEKEEIHDNRT